MFEPAELYRVLGGNPSADRDLLESLGAIEQARESDLELQARILPRQFLLTLPGRRERSC